MEVQKQLRRLSSVGGPVALLMQQRWWDGLEIARYFTTVATRY